MSKLINILDLFRKGNVVADPEVWKDASNTVSLLVPIMMTAVKLAGDFGYGIQLSTEDAVAIASGIVACVQFVIHNISSTKAGILPAKSDPDPGQTVERGPYYESLGDSTGRGNR